MAVTTFEGVVKDGRIDLPPGVRLPENARVYVVVPNLSPGRTARILSPRLAHPEQTPEFRLEVTKVSDDAGV